MISRFRISRWSRGIDASNQSSSSSRRDRSARVGGDAARAPVPAPPSSNAALPAAVAPRNRRRLSRRSSRSVIGRPPSPHPGGPMRFGQSTPDRSARVRGCAIRDPSGGPSLSLPPLPSLPTGSPGPPSCSVRASRSRRADEPRARAPRRVSILVRPGSSASPAGGSPDAPPRCPVCRGRSGDR